LDPPIDLKTKSIKLSLFLGSLSNLPAKLAFHARSPPDGLLTSLSDFNNKMHHRNEDACPKQVSLENMLKKCYTKIST
jgi:hypothetical protein